jgi:hypothetical protein
LYYEGTTGDVPDLESAVPTLFFSNEDTNPGFLNAASSDFRPSETSAMIDAGAHLTTITQATGSGTSFTVNDARYFFDGWGAFDGNGAALSGDTIKTASGQTATITSIVYATNTITVGSSISWTNGEGISLSYNGTAPDIGYDEYSPSDDHWSFVIGGGTHSMNVTTGSQTWDIY